MSQPPPNDLFKAAEQSLSQSDFHKCREYALAVPKSDPRFPRVAQILAVADTLIAAQSKVPDWYAILQLGRYSSCNSVIDQFKKLYRLLNPAENRFPLANEAAELVYLAYSVLRDSSTKLEFDDELLASELPKLKSPFQVLCNICSDRFSFDNKAYEDGVFRCQKCRTKSIKPQSKNEPKIIEKSEGKGLKCSFCKLCSEPFLEVANEWIIESFICSYCIWNLDEPNTDSLSAYFPVGFDEGREEANTNPFSAYFPGGLNEGREGIEDALNSKPTGAVNYKSVADHQINVEEGGEDDDTIWISCPTCTQRYLYSGVRQKRVLLCKNPECRGKGRAPEIFILRPKEEDEKISGENVKILMEKGVDAAGKDNADHQINAGIRQERCLRRRHQEYRGRFRPPKMMISYQKEKDKKYSGENVKILRGEGVDAAGKDNAGNGKGNDNQGTKVIRKLWNPVPIRAKNSMGQENLSGENKSAADHGINVEGVGGENAAAAAAETVRVNCPHCSFKFKQVGDPQEGLPKCQNAVCGKEFNVLDGMLLYQKEEDNQDKKRKFQD